MKKFFSLSTHARITLGLTIICGAVIAVVTIIQMTLLSQIVDQAFLAHRDLALLWPLLFLLLALVALRAALLWIREVAAQWGTIRVKAKLRERLFAHLLALGPLYCKGERTGELVTVAYEGIERLDAYISRYIPQMVLSGLNPLLIALYLFPIDWISTLLLLVTCPVIPLLMILIGSYTEMHAQKQWSTLSLMGAHFLDAVQGLTTLKLFGRVAYEHDLIKRINDSFRTRTLKVLRMAFLSGAVLEFLTALAIGLVAVALGIRLLNGGITFQHAFLVLLLAPEFYRPLRELGSARHAAMEGKAAAQRLGEILATPLPAQANATTMAQLKPHIALELQNVTYRYAQSEQPALNGISLSLPARSCTALVGKSGAGKSTLANLLMRFMEPQTGAITVNGVPLRNLPTPLWREYVALVPQRPYLFYGTVMENIHMARPDASLEAIEQAAELAGASEFIQKLPQGYTTMIGERGARLSAGQVQRLAIARAFLKDAPLLVLDEPTSHLDPHSEALIREALAKLIVGRTVLVIAHKLNTVMQSDQVAVLEHGMLVEVGQHRELLAANGVYTRLMGAVNEGAARV
jgi:ATP-binding cassette subfamily C protein CydD